MRTDRPTLARRFTSALLAAGLLGACGGGDDGDRAQGGSAKPTTTTTTTTPAADEAATSTTTTTAAPAPPTTATSATTATTKPAAAKPPAPAVQDSETGGAPLDLTGMTVVGPAPDDDAGLDVLAAQLVADERAIRSGAGAEPLSTVAVRQQSAYRAVAANMAVLPRLLDRAPPELRDVVRANADAGAFLRSMTKPRTGLPPWHIVQPPPPEELEGYYREAESRYGVPWAYLAAVHLVETRMGRIRGVSTAGAQGPMQFMPATWEAYGEGDINNPRDAILAAARYLQRNGAPGDMRKALWNYNHSYKYVDAVNLYAQQMQADGKAYPAYWNWQVFYITVKGDVLLPVGYQGS